MNVHVPDKLNNGEILNIFHTIERRQYFKSMLTLISGTVVVYCSFIEVTSKLPDPSMNKIIIAGVLLTGAVLSTFFNTRNLNKLFQKASIVAGRLTDSHRSSLSNVVKAYHQLNWVEKKFILPWSKRQIEFRRLIGRVMTEMDKLNPPEQRLI